MTALSRIALFSLLLLFSTLMLVAQPAIQLSSAKYDLGRIYHGEVRTVPVVVRNTGTEPLNITGVETSCGCTSAKRSVEAIAPGAADTISVSFNSLGFSGSITKVVTVHSNDPLKPNVEARLSGTVVSILETVPPMQVINFGGSEMGKPASVSLLFKNTTMDPVTIRTITSPDPAVRSFAAGIVPPNDSVTILFSYTPASKNFVENYFYIETTDPRQPRIPFRFMYLGR